MADNYTQRNFRSNDRAGRMAADDPPQGGNDPLAELARLIGQNDPFGEFGRERTQSRAAATRTYPAHESNVDDGPYPDEAYPQPSTSAREAQQDDWGPVPGYPESRPDDSAYEQQTLERAGAAYGEEEQEYYEDIPPPRRRVGLLAIAAVFALAVIGTAGAYGYRTMFGSASSGPPPVIKADASPAKVVPPKKDAQSAKLINDRVGEQKLLSREEKPVDLAIRAPGALTQDQRVADASPAPVLGSGVVGPDPKKVHTIIIRPDQPSGNSMIPVAAAAAAPQEQHPAAPAAEPKPVTLSEPAAPPPNPAPAAPPRSESPAESHHQTRHEARVASAERNAPLSLDPNAPSQARSASTHRARTASLAPAPAAAAHAASGGYAVQVSSRRSEAEAKAAVHQLQSKYSSVLGRHPVLVRRVDLGAKGVYYRAMIGPFGSSANASKVCSDLKKAGGSCFVQRI
jgi:hypothetical protein